MAGVLDIAKSIALAGWKEASSLPTREFRGKIESPSEASTLRALPEELAIDIQQYQLIKMYHHVVVLGALQGYFGCSYLQRGLWRALLGRARRLRPPIAKAILPRNPLSGDLP